MVIDISRNKQYSILRDIGKKAIDKTKNRFTKYNISKYFKLCKNSKEDKQSFINGDESYIEIIDCESPAEFNEEYGYNDWLQYNEIFNFIYTFLENEIKHQKLNGNIEGDLEKDGGSIYYESDD